MLYIVHTTYNLIMIMALVELYFPFGISPLLNLLA
jgi:hypothetical protein